MITWRRLGEHDFALVREWLRQPHVARWWNHDTSMAGVIRDFAPAARGEEPSEDLLAYLDGAPVGLVQRCRLDDYPAYRDDLAAIAEVPKDAMTIDYLVGDPNRLGHGLGSRMIDSAIASIWSDVPVADTVVVPVPLGNISSWRALEKAGFERVAVGDLEPDNPIDGRAHALYRIDRPILAA